MPHFARNPLELLTLQPGEADADLDLRGLTVEEALAQVAGLLAAPRDSGPRSYRLLFDPPSGDGRETLFQPLGRQLLAARRAGTLGSCLPLADGAGYYIVLPD